MDMTLTDEQLALREGVRDVLADTCSPQRVAELADGGDGWDPAVWSTLANMGLIGLSVPETLGGAGAGMIEEVILFEQAGAALAPAPLLSTVALALPALVASPVANEVVPGVVAGEHRVGVAWADDGRSTFLARAAATTFPADLAEDGETAVLNGTKQWVIDVPALDSLVVAARTATGAGLFLVDTAEPGVTVVPVDTADRTRSMSTVTFADVTGRSLVDPARSWPVFGAIWRSGLLLAAAESVGVSARLLELDADYARTREQFGRPIGSYQAVSHQVADIYMHAELARSLCYWGAMEAEAGTNSVDVAVAGAASYAFPAAVSAAEHSIQIHGGIGMTWESILHRYLKRALALSALDAPPELQRHQISRIVLGG